MIKTISRLIILILIGGFITISPRTSFIVGVTIEQISSFFMWNVKYKHREKWVIDKSIRISTQILNPSN